MTVKDNHKYSQAKERDSEETNPNGSLGFCEKLLWKSLVCAILFIEAVAKNTP